MRPRILLALAVATSAAPPAFQPVQPDLLSIGGSFTNAWADYDGDGDLDLFVGFGGATANRLYRNDNGVLADVAQAAGVADARATLSAAWADYDADGDPDLLVGFGTAPILKLYRNDAGQFTDVARDVAIARDSGRVRQLSWVDYDGDGDLDLFVAFRDRANAMFRNTNGRFADVAAQIGLDDRRRTVGAIWFDYDEDGDLDLYVGNMDGDANALMRNDSASARFTDIAFVQGLSWAGREPSTVTQGTVRPCVADVNNDGHLDLFGANYGKTGLFLSRGLGRFADSTLDWKAELMGSFDSCAFADFDNDGKVDLYVNGTITGGTSYRDYLLQNSGKAFADVTPDNIKALEADHGVQWADFDNDGDEDLALAGTQPSPKGMHLLMRNMLGAGDNAGFLRVLVLDANGRQTLAGAEVRLYAAGTKDVLGTRLVDTGSGYNSQNAMPVQFGLGARRNVDVEVIVPRRGSRRPALISGIDSRTWAKCALKIRVVADGSASVEGAGCR